MPEYAERMIPDSWAEQIAAQAPTVARIKAEMAERKISQAEMARRLHCSPSKVSRTLRHGLPWSFCMLFQYFRALGYPPDGSARSNAAIDRLLGLS